jgi:hypothetical protein
VGRIVRHVLAAVAGFAPGLLLQLAWNHIRYGHPLSDPTPNAEQVTLPDWQQFRERLFGQLLSSGRGMALFHLAPAVVICLAFREWWRRAHDLVVLWIGCTAATLLFFTLFDFWHGGTSYGPRYTLALLALGATAWGHLPERPTPAARTALAAAAVAGFLTMVPGVLVDPVCIDMHHQWLMEYRRPWLAAGWAEVRAVTTGTRPKLPPGLPASAYTLETHPQFQVPDLWWCHLVHRLRDSRASSGSVPAPVPTTRP